MNRNVPFLSFDPRANGVSNASVFHRVCAAIEQEFAKVSLVELGKAVNVA
jgi:hypothetical protein